MLRSCSNRTLFMVLLVVSVAVLLAGAVTADSTGGDALFDVEITETNGPVAEGETLIVTATVTNTGTTDGSQQIHLKNFDNEVVDSVAAPPLTLAPGESKQVTLTWATTTTGVGEVTVASDDAYPSQQVEITEPAAFELAVGDIPEAISVGEQITVPVTVTNVGGTSASTPVRLAVDESIEDERAVELAPGDTRMVNLTWESTDAGESTLVVSAGDARIERTVRVEERSDTGGSGGSGGSTDLSPLVVERSNALIDGTVANISGHDIDRVVFEEPVDGRITVDRLRRFPSDVDPIGNVVAIYRFDVPDEAVEMTGRIEVTIDAERLDGAATDSVRVASWNGTEWTILDTETNVSNGTATIDAETRGFSLFAVTTGAGGADAEADGETSDGSTDETDSDTDEDHAASDGDNDTASDDENEATGDDADDDDAASDNATDDDEADDDETNGDETASGNETDDETNGDETNEVNDDGAADDADDSGPGFGVGAALAALGSVGYLLRRRRV